MNDTKRLYHGLVYFLYKWINPFFNPVRFLLAFPRYIRFFKDMMVYQGLKGAERNKISDIYPCIHEKTQTTDVDKHYFYQDIWAAQKIYDSKIDYHVDVGSRVIFAGFLTSFTKVAFIDIRPPKVDLKNFEKINGDILSMPFGDNSVKSLSSLSVAEHIGLGRYGDKLNPSGTKEACKELTRVLAPGGSLYFSLPVGKQRLCFNGMRIHSPEQIIKYFSGLKLVEFSAVDDSGKFVKNADISVFKNSFYSCGLFWFKK